MVSTKPQKPTTYWHDDQLAVIHHSDFDISEPKEKIIASLNLKGLHSFIGDNGFSLESFTWQDVPRPSSQRDNTTLKSERQVRDLSKQNPLESPIGKYLFRDPSGGTLVVSFFRITRSPGKTKKAPHVINLVNTKLHSAVMQGTQAAAQSEAQLITEYAEPGMKLIAAMPHFWCASTNGPDHATNGCPISPPFPVPPEENPTGKWHFDLLSDISCSFKKEATGDGVFVFVLDTLPPPEQIYQADKDCKGRNTLLRDIAKKVRLNYRVLSDSLDDPLENAPMTGWDINGERVNFPMEDHGVFIAGIILDLAPDSKVECIRVLNDYGVGNTAMLVDALSHIQNRLLEKNPETGKQGDLYKKRVVVNMSLTATPPEEMLEEWGYTDKSIAPARLALLKPLQALAKQGVVFAASAGNGSGPNNQYTKPQGKRVGPRFPAAFAYGLPGFGLEESIAAMIPVGAINGEGKAASYSNYPGDLGIGTYGGELPRASKEEPNNSTGTQVEKPVDAVRGVYTASYYPAMAKTDSLPTLSPAPILYPLYKSSFSSTWAYWSGTSFATPIISALAARVMETQKSEGDSVRETLRSSTHDEVDWTDLYAHLPNGEDHAQGAKFLVSQEWENHEA